MAARGSLGDLRDASAEFVSAVRFAMFAEKVTAELAELRQVQALPSNVKGLAPAERTARAKAKLAAAELIPALEAMLFPEGE